MLYKLSNLLKKYLSQTFDTIVRLSSGLSSAKYGYDCEHGSKYGPPHVPTIHLNTNPTAKCPTVIKAIHCNPTQYASISIQVHSQLLTAIKTGLLECDQVASTPIIHYITEDH